MAEKFDVVVIGAGAAGLMCAAEAGKRGRKVLVLDHAKNRAARLLSRVVGVVISLTTMYRPKTTCAVIRISSNRRLPSTPTGTLFR